MFNSKKNLELIWNLLSENRQLNQNNKILFDTTVKDIQQNSNSFPSLLAMNKYLINVCNANFSYKNLQNLENEIKQMKQPDAPKNIDFTDKHSENYENVDVLMNKTMASREKELQNYANNFKTNNKITIGTDIIEIKTNNILDKKVTFDLKSNITKMCIKINFTENNIQKTMFCNVNKHFRVFLGSTDSPDDISVTIENMEIIL